MIKKFILYSFIAFFGNQLYAQTDSTFVDKKYLEDQLYFGISYNLLVNTPSGFNQNGISGGLVVGFIKDIPLNKNRNVGLGVGLGYSYNAYNNNLKITDNGQFEIVPNENFSSNRFSTYLIEAPLEIRWRTSTPTVYSFWRVYTGVKFSYVFYSTSKYSDNVESIKVENVDELKQLQYGLTLSAGYSTFNLHLYYGLNSLFKDATTVTNDAIDLKQFNIGLIFYIL